MADEQNSVEQVEPYEKFRVNLDAMADFHSRLGDIESRQLVLSRRLTAIEESRLGMHDDELFDKKTMGIIVLLMVMPMLLDMATMLVARWKQSS